MAKLALFLLLLGTLSCGSSSKKSSPIQLVAKDLQAANEGKLSNLGLSGENQSGRFSPHGNKIIFISRNRSRHQQGQVYSFNLQNGREQRLTYQDGENAHPFFDVSGSYFFYSSTTDEIKEDPQFIRDSLLRLQGRVPPASSLPPKYDAPFEIYKSSLDGSSISRVTSSQGYDGEGSLHPFQESLAFASARRSPLGVYIVNLASQRAHLVSGPNRAAAEPSFSPDGKRLVWVSYSKDWKTSQLIVADATGKNPFPITTAPFLHRSPRWFPDSQWIIFVSEREEPGNKDIYAIRKDGTCLQRITRHSAEDFAPDVSPNGKQILFSSLRAGKSQLFLLDYELPKTCPEDQPTVR